MALTKISTGGVKDDAASQAIIADEAIDEARLQISNAGSNGEFLQKQSGNTGGLTWAAANQYTHPNHSGEVTSTADGAQVIADDVVDEANLKVSNSPTNGYFLSAQSGNTGGLTWAEVQSAPTVTAVASGALTAGKVVHLMSDGKVKVATETAASIESTKYEDDSTYHPCGCYDEDNDRIVVFYVEGPSDMKLKAKVGTVDSNGDISFGSEVDVNDNEIRHVDCCWEPTSGAVMVIYSNYDSSTWPRIECGRVSGTTITFSGADNINNEPSTFNMITAGAANTVLAGYRDHNSNTTYRVLTISGTGGSTSASKGSAQNIDGKGVPYAAAYSSSLSSYCVVYKDQDDSNKFKAQILNSSGQSQTGTGSSAIVISTTAANSAAVYWDSVSEKFVIVGGSKIYVGTATANSLSIGTGVDLDGGDSCDLQNHCIHQIGTAKVRVFYKKWDSGDKWKFVDATVSGTSVTLDTAVQMGGPGDAAGLIWNPDNSTYYYVMFVGGGDGTVGRWKYATTSVNDENYLGFASANYSDGDTATINIVGNTSTQSSLTPGQKYYVTNDGGISTSTGSANVAVGKALTSTNLLIL